LSSKHPTAGIRVNARIGDVVNAGDVLADIYGGSPHTSLKDAFVVRSAPPVRHPFVYATI
ncbi:MAG TPA: hypothetical protein VFN49_12680, partial [Candidatus Aquilonibacter sp.]|nr:hypothetical protein [Candidatus Aquilonibacter sp.]